MCLSIEKLNIKKNIFFEDFLKFLDFFWIRKLAGIQILFKTFFFEDFLNFSEFFGFRNWRKFKFYQELSEKNFFRCFQFLEFLIF